MFDQALNTPLPRWTRKTPPGLFSFWMSCDRLKYDPLKFFVEGGYLALCVDCKLYKL